jgi:hypothetical protein
MGLPKAHAQSKAAPAQQLSDVQLINPVPGIV